MLLSTVKDTVRESGEVKEWFDNKCDVIEKRNKEKFRMINNNTAKDNVRYKKKIKETTKVFGKRKRSHIQKQLEKKWKSMANEKISDNFMKKINYQKNSF